MDFETAIARARLNGPEMTHEIATLRAERDRLRSALAQADAALHSAERLTTAALQEKAAEPESTAPGPVREAKALLRFPVLDTIARRKRALSIAWTGSNLGLWGTWSACVHGAAQDLARMIEDGREQEEHYVEKTARLDREQTAALQEARLQQAAIAAGVRD